MSRPTEIVTIDNLSKQFFVRTKKQSLLSSVLHIGQKTASLRTALIVPSLKIGEGEQVGIIGHNGSGKSTLLRTLAGIYLPSEGTYRIYGNSIYISGHAFSFYPRFTMRQNIETSIQLFGIISSRISYVRDAIIDFSGLSRHTEEQVSQFSSGMFARLGFSCMKGVIEEVHPDVLLLDEAFDIGTDEAFRDRASSWLSGGALTGRTVLCASHDLTAMATHMTRVLVLESGHLVHDGDPVAAIAEYRKRLLCL